MKISPPQPEAPLDLTQPRPDPDANWLLAMALVESAESPYGQRLKMIAARIESDAERNRALSHANKKLIRDANTSNALLGERCEQLEAELAAPRERERALREALRLAREALRAPIDDWKGEVERRALNAINAVLATPDSAAPTGEAE